MLRSGACGPQDAHGRTPLVFALGTGVTDLVGLLLPLSDLAIAVRGLHLLGRVHLW